MKECPECKKVFAPDEPEQVFHDRHCARTFQARHGVPSIEDKKWQLMDTLSRKFDEIFKEKP